MLVPTKYSMCYVTNIKQGDCKKLIQTLRGSWSTMLKSIGIQCELCTILVIQLNLWLIRNKSIFFILVN
jgi:hypothetical protein